MSINHGPQRKEIQAKVMRSLAFNCSVCNCDSGSPGAMAFGLCLYLREYSPAPIPSSFRTHCAGCRPEGAPVGDSASLHNSGTGWWRALQIDGALLRWQVEPGIGLRWWVSGPGPTRPQCTSGKPSPQVSHLPVHPAYLWAAPAAVAHWTRNRCPHYAWLHSKG